jgi:hypothetical protein
MAYSKNLNAIVMGGMSREGVFPSDEWLKERTLLQAWLESMRASG